MAGARDRIPLVYYAPSRETKTRRCGRAGDLARAGAAWYRRAMGALTAMVLSAGHGTRLRPLTDHLPKPLVPVGDRSVLEHVVSHLRAYDAATRVVVNAHHLAAPLGALCAREHIEVSVEQALLGTAGGVRHAAPLLGAGATLVWNGDILSDIDVGALLSAHVELDARATLAVVARAAGEGNVGFDARGRVTRLRSETTGPGEERGGDFTGVHVLGERLRETLPPSGCLVGDVYLPLLREGGALCVHVVDARFSDVGTPGAYLDENLAWLSRTGRDAWVGEGARVTAEVVRSVVGAGAEVRAAIEACVVWPGAIVEEPARRALVGPWGVLAVPDGA
jgi:mannose-1-phosphate guanylyltransferase